MPLYKHFVSFLFLIGSLFNAQFSFSQDTLSKVHVAKDNAACLYGFKNDSGRWVVPAQFTSVGRWGAARFEAGFMLVNKNEEYGLVDEYGNITVPVEYDELELLTHLTQE